MLREQKDRRLAPGPHLLEQEVFRMASHLSGLGMLTLAAAVLFSRAGTAYLCPEAPGPWGAVLAVDQPQGAGKATVVLYSQRSGPGRGLGEPSVTERVTEDSSYASFIWQF